jgi:hypothetical protein
VLHCRASPSRQQITEFPEEPGHSGGFKMGKPAETHRNP